MSRWHNGNLEKIINELAQFEAQAGFVDEALDYLTIREFIEHYLEMRGIELEEKENHE